MSGHLGDGRGEEVELNEREIPRLRDRPRVGTSSEVACEKSKPDEGKEEIVGHASDGIIDENDSSGCREGLGL